MLQFTCVLNQRISTCRYLSSDPPVAGLFALSFPFRMRVHPRTSYSNIARLCWRRTRDPEAGASSFSANSSPGIRLCEHLEVFRLYDLLARIDVNKHGHWSLLSFRLP